ncbi:heterokaryon incompatibility protein-domain-containing protein [Leptodontidium sp. MPI-SDFR-AT-0119]|nr:heterokaryon incompatibility protein-domain-containing protein [Leptodontidium sp. MPI-SDFR-AT-0119]
MYFPLHTQEIRLVDILPGAWKDEVQCILRHASVSNNPSYKALSYVWGAAKATRRSIIVNGNTHLVTVNLEHALRRIRQPDTMRTFWIDALSINQDDNEERSTQVGMMRNIYARASEVVIYLGDAPHHEFAGGPTKKQYPSALSVFHGDSRDEKVISEFQSHCLPEDTRKDSASKKKLNYAHEVCCLISLLAQTSDLENVPPFDVESRPRLDSFYQRNVFEALRYLMRSSWWNRIWVIQEIVVPQNIILHYDTTTAPWDMFVKAAQNCTKNSFTPRISSFPREYSDVLSFFSRIVLDIYHLRCQWGKAETTTLLSLLRQFSNRKASDDRDKVYALLGLVTETTASGSQIISPDYSLDTVTVFKNTVLSIIESTGSLSILTGDLGRKNRQDLPSWAVDWSATSDDVDRRRAEDTEMYNASAGKIVRTQRYHEPPYAGVSKYLEQLETELESAGRSVPSNSSYREKYTFLLSSAEWEKYCVIPGTQRSEWECLEAIQNYLAIEGRLVWLREVKDVLDCPGLYKGKVVMIGKPSFSNDDLDFLVRAWGSTVSFYTENMNNSHVPIKRLDESFVKALCADIAHPDSHIGGSKRRRATKTELEEIVSWIWQLGGVPGPVELWERLSHQHSLSVSTEIRKISPSMLASIQTATFKRRLFITNTGFLGIGPAGLQTGDNLYLLLGGTAPFILREASIRKVPLIANRPVLGSVERVCSEIIGDCYVHGLMDGEGLGLWKDAATKSFEHSKEQLHTSLSGFQQCRAIEEETIQGRKVISIIKTPEFESWLDTLRSTGEAGVEEAGLEKRNVVSMAGTGKPRRSVRQIDDEIREWLLRQELMTWFETIDIQDCFRMAKEIVKKLEEDLKLAKKKLDHSTVELQKMDLESEDSTHVFIV